MSRLIDGALRIALTGIHWAMKAGWFVRRPKTFGAHAIALTSEGKLILVKLRYAPGWRLPGGGRSRHEDPLEAALRELREEIGMLSHGEAQAVRDFQEATDFKRDTASLTIVRNVRYRPHRWSWEVEEVSEFAPDSLPRDLSPIAARWIEAARPLL